MKSENREIIVRILEGSATSEERQLFLEWLDADEKNREEFKQIESIWNAVDILKNKDNFEYQSAYRAFTEKTKEIGSQKKQSRSVFAYLMQSQFTRIAAIFVILIAFAFIGNYLLKPNGNEATAYFETITPNGSKSQLVLPDGTKIWLNAGSKLRYPGKFSPKVREVYLEGEGYFEVTKDPHRPFIVKTSDISIKVLGTVFNVKSYPLEETIETTLVSGSVVIEGRKENGKPVQLITLAPNQKATFIKKGNKISINGSENKSKPENDIKPISDTRTIARIELTDKVNAEIYTSWKNNSLIFDNEPFESIATKLERRYGAKIVFSDDSIKKYRFSGRFDEISIDQALNALKYASPFKYEIKDNTIYIGSNVKH